MDLYLNINRDIFGFIVFYSQVSLVVMMFNHGYATILISKGFVSLRKILFFQRSGNEENST